MTSVPGVAGVRSRGILHSVGTSNRIFVAEYELKIREKNIEMKRNKSRDPTQQ